MHSFDPAALEYAPLEHAVHVSNMSVPVNWSLAVPAGHEPQLVEPVSGAALPLEQNEQVVAPD